MTLLTGLAAIALYLSLSLYQWLQLRRQQPLNLLLFRSFAGVAIAAHGLSSACQIFTPQGVDFSLLHISSAIFFIINLTVLLSSLKKPVQILFIALFPLSVLVLAAALYTHSTLPPVTHVPLPIGLHIVLSILAYSLLSIAIFQALLLAIQNWRLKHKHLGGWGQGLPPLEIMEALLFEMLWAGFLLLTLSILTGLLFFEDIFAQQLSHKTFFSIASWLFYGILLGGHQLKGWRGNTAIRWTIGGFAALAVAYWGSKMVIEYFL